MPQSPEQMTQAMIDNMQAKTGKSLQQWLTIVAKTKLAKHGQILQHLKSAHGIGHGYASLIAHRHLAGVGAPAAGDDLVNAQYSGPKESLKPIYDAVTEIVRKLGDDVEVSPKKTCVSYRRRKQFALIQASTRDRVDLGINLRGQDPAGRLEPSGSFNAMVSHRVRLSSPKEVNGEIQKWLRQAYDAA